MPSKWNRSRIVLVFSVLWLPLVLSSCDSSVTTGPAVEEPKCHGSVYVQAATVTRVEPAPATTYAVPSTSDWTPPWSVQVTGGGKAEVYVRSPDDILLITFQVYNNGSVHLEKKDGTWATLIMSGGVYVAQDGVSPACNITKEALGTTITESSTEYAVVVRPKVDEVQIYVVKGSLIVTARDGATVELNADTAPAIIIQNGQPVFKPFFPPVGPDQVLDYLEKGLDLFGVDQTDSMPAAERQADWLKRQP
jgi:hypothetical protein